MLLFVLLVLLPLVVMMFFGCSFTFDCYHDGSLFDLSSNHQQTKSNDEAQDKKNDQNESHQQQRTDTASNNQ
jgi:hypothetical protein